MSSRACAPVALSLSARSPSTRTCTGSVTSAAPRASSLRLPSSSGKGTRIVDRRDFIVSVTGGLLAAPVTVTAQPPPGRVWRIGYVTAGVGRVRVDDTFDAAMKQLGYVEGQNLVVERRYLGQRSGTADEVMQELARLNVDAMVTWAAPPSLAAKRATST